MKEESKIFKAFRYLCLSFVVVIGLVAIIGTGGGGGDGGGGDVSNVVLPETTKVLDDSTLQHLSSVSPDGSTFTFDESTPQLDSLNSNDVIVFNVTDVTPYGALRKVTSVSQVGDAVVVETTQATLEDAIESGTIEVARTLTASDIQSANALIKGIALKAHSVTPQAAGSLHVDMNNVVLYDEDGNLGTTNDQIRANGAIDIDPGFEFRLEMDWFTIEELSFINKTTETANLELSSQISIGTRNKVEIARYYFNPITVSILVITPVLTVNVGFDGEVSVGMTTNFTQTAILTAGVAYHYESGWSPVIGFSHAWQFDPPVLSADAAVKGYAGPQLSLLLYGVTGPYGDINVYLELYADLFGDPWWELYGGIFADIGIEVEVLGYSIVDHYTPICNYRIKFADSNGPLNNPPTANITSPSDGSEYDEGATVIFSGTGNDPEDGSLTGGSLVWTSSRDGQIGTGTYFTRDNLSVGTHTITLTATDSQGATGTDSINITVNPIGNNPPTANITSPSDGTSYDEGATIIFSGTGDDPEDGSLTGGSLVWTSSRDGQIGTGTYFTRDNLSVGTHIITLTATDSQGATGADSVTITVNEPNSKDGITVSITSTPPTAAIGETITVYGTMYNGGSLPAYDPYCRGYFTPYSEPPLYSYVFMPYYEYNGILQPGYSVSFSITSYSIPESLGTGDRYVVLIAANDEGIDPRGTGQNYDSVPITILPVGGEFSVNILSPDQGSTLSGLVTISSNVTSNNGVDRVEYYLWGTIPEWIDNTPHPGAGTWTYHQDWNTDLYWDGEFTIRVVAYDSDGISVTDQVTVTSQNGHHALDVSPTELSFEPPDNQKSFYILGTTGGSYIGGAIIRYTIEKHKDWIELSKYEGYVEPVETDEIVVTIDYGQLPCPEPVPCLYSDVLYVNSNSGFKQVPIMVNVPPEQY